LISETKHSIPRTIKDLHLWLPHRKRVEAYFDEIQFELSRLKNELPGNYKNLLPSKQQVASIIMHESYGIKDTLGDKGKSFGLMQVQIATASESKKPEIQLGFIPSKETLLDPRNNIRAGIIELVRSGYQLFGSSKPLTEEQFLEVAKRYNAGPVYKYRHNVSPERRERLIQKTNHYAEKVMHCRKILELDESVLTQLSKPKQLIAKK